MTSKELTEELTPEVNSHNFGEALKFLQRGYRISRPNWNGKEMYLVMLDNASLGNFQLNPDLKEELFTLKYHVNSIILLRTSEGNFVPWCPSQTDILAEDWYVHPKV